MAKKDSSDSTSAKGGDQSEGKAKALGLALESIEKQFGKGSIMKLGEAHRVDVETMSVGALSLDIALGSGIPKGRIVEIYGPESSGKTTLTLHAIAEVFPHVTVWSFLSMPSMPLTPLTLSVLVSTSRICYSASQITANKHSKLLRHWYVAMLSI